MLSALFFLTLAAGPVRVASPAWNVVDIKPELAHFYEEQLAEALRKEGLAVTTAGDISTILGNERQKQLLGCDADSKSCMAELANALGCEATLTVNLARLGTSFRGLAKLMNSRDGSVMSSVKIEAASESQLADHIERAAKELARPLVSTTSPTAAVPIVEAPQPERHAPMLWWLPGALGLVPAGIGVTMIGLAAGKFQELQTKPVSSQQATLWANEGEGLQTLGWILSGTGAAAIVGSVLWLVLGSTTVTPVASISTTGATLGFVGSF